MLAAEQMAIIEKHQKDAPVQIVPIASELGLNVYRVGEWPNNVSGMIAPDKERGGKSGYAIFVNADHCPIRRRFIIAHEIGHFILHPHLIGDGMVEDTLLRAQGLSNWAETEANRIAANILMPWKLISRFQDQGMRSIEDLAEKFNVSKDAMSIRLLGLSYVEAPFSQGEK